MAWSNEMRSSCLSSSEALRAPTDDGGRFECLANRFGFGSISVRVDGQGDSMVFGSALYEVEVR